MKTRIVIPMKDPVQSKQRLAQVLESNQRQRLALLLFRQTLSFLNHYFPEIPILVVTPSPRIEKIAKRYGADTLIEATTGLNNAITLAAEFNVEKGFDSQLILPADIAELCVIEIQTLLDLHCKDNSVVICPASDGGTNALLTSPPNIMPFCFGLNSSKKHADMAAELNLGCKIIPMQKLTFDLDTPADLQYWSQGFSGMQFFAGNPVPAMS